MYLEPLLGRCVMQLKIDPTHDKQIRIGLGRDEYLILVTPPFTDGNGFGSLHRTYKSTRAPFMARLLGVQDKEEEVCRIMVYEGGGYRYLDGICKGEELGCWHVDIIKHYDPEYGRGRHVRPDQVMFSDRQR